MQIPGSATAADHLYNIYNTPSGIPAYLPCFHSYATYLLFTNTHSLLPSKPDSELFIPKNVLTKVTLQFSQTQLWIVGIAQPITWSTRHLCTNTYTMVSCQVVQLGLATGLASGSYGLACITSVAVTIPKFASDELTV